MGLKEEVASKNSKIESLTHMVNKLQSDLDESEEARRQLKIDIMNLEEKIIVMEQEIYEMETTQLDLVNQLKDVENANMLAEEKIAQLVKANEDLEKG